MLAQIHRVKSLGNRVFRNRLSSYFDVWYQNVCLLLDERVEYFLPPLQALCRGFVYRSIVRKARHRNALLGIHTKWGRRRASAVSIQRRYRGARDRAMMTFRCFLSNGWSSRYMKKNETKKNKMSSFELDLDPNVQVSNHLKKENNQWRDELKVLQYGFHLDRTVKRKKKLLFGIDIRKNIYLKINNDYNDIKQMKKILINKLKEKRKKYERNHFDVVQLNQKMIVLIPMVQKSRTLEYPLTKKERRDEIRKKINEETEKKNGELLLLNEKKSNQQKKFTKRSPNKRQKRTTTINYTMKQKNKKKKQNNKNLAKNNSNKKDNETIIHSENILLENENFEDSIEYIQKPLKEVP